MPIGVLLWFVIEGFNKDINSTEKEIWGNKVINPIKQLITLIPQHQRFVIASKNINQKSYFNIDDASVSRLQIQIDSCISEIFEIYPNLESEYNNTKREIYSHQANLIENLNILEQWNNIKKNVHNNSINNVSNYDNISDELELLLRFVGDKSGLILDTDLDSY